MKLQKQTIPRLVLVKRLREVIRRMYGAVFSPHYSERGRIDSGDTRNPAVLG